MKRLFALFAGILIGLSVFGQQNFSLEEAIGYGLAANNKIKLAKIEVADAEGQLLEYKSIGIPKVNASVDYNYFPQVPQFLIPRQFIDPDAPEGSFTLLPAGTEQSMVAKIDASAILFDAGWLVGLKAQRLYRELVTRQGESSEDEVKAGVTKAYLSILIAEKNKEVLDKNISNLTKTLKETKAIYENGFAEKLDVDRLQLSFNNLNVEAEKLNRLIAISYNLLKFQMGYPMGDEITISDDLEMLMAKFTAEVVEMDAPIDFNTRSEYSAIQLGEELAKINIRRYRMSYIPVLNAFGSHQQQLQRNNLFDEQENGWFGTTVVGLSLKVPVFDGLDRKAKIQRARILLDKTLIQKNDFERAVTLEIKNARTAYLNSRQSVSTTEKSLELAQEIYNTTQIKFKEGVGSSLEVAQAERELYTAQANFTNALYELLIAKSDLDKAIGK